MKEKCKIFGVSCILFFGAAFAIMTFNADVSVENVFENLYQILYQNGGKSNGVLEFGYAVGIAVGILIFYNHFGNKTIVSNISSMDSKQLSSRSSDVRYSEPSPLEIKMWQYENTVKQYQEEKAQDNQRDKYKGKDVKVVDWKNQDLSFNRKK